MSQDPDGRVVVAGHICLDIIPAFETHHAPSGTLLTPGKLVNVGPALLSTGGAVSNTGLALHRLGVPTSLMGKIGDDLFGRAILDVIRGRDPSLADGMVVSADAPSSYTIVISPPGIDRSFLHCPGANDTFGPEDVDVPRLAGTRIFHFGYPPLMRRMHIDGGGELTALLRKVKEAGIATSLDLAHVDANSPAGRIDWRGLLQLVLPYVDFFLPSLDEVFSILQPQRFRQAVEQHDGDFMADVNAALLHDLAGELLDFGAAIVALKMGDRGVYLRTTPDAARLDAVAGMAFSPAWLGRELLAPAYAVDLVGTTGAGDCAIAGFFAGVLRGQEPEQALTSAVAAGGANVERADAISGVPAWDALQGRVAAGWDKLPLRLPLPGWRWSAAHNLWAAPDDPLYAALPAA